MSTRWLALLAVVTACKKSAKHEAQRPPEAGVAATAATSEIGRVELARDDRFLYWYDDAGVHRRELGGPAPRAAELLPAKVPKGDEDRLERLAVHDGVLYVQRAYALLAVPLDGGAPRTLVERALRDVAVDDSGVYVASEDRVLRIPPDGGAPVEVVDAPAEVGQIALLDGSVYWLEHEDGTIRRVPRAGGSPEDVLHTGRWIGAFAVDARGLVIADEAVLEQTNAGPMYVRRGFRGNQWIDGVAIDDAWVYAVIDGELTVTARDDDDPVVIAGGPHLDMWAQVAAGKLFWIETVSEDNADVRVVSFDLASNTATELAPFADRPLELEVGGGFVYWCGVDGEGVWRAPVAGGAAELYSKVDFLDGGYLGFGDGVVYWSEGPKLRARREGSSEVVDLGAITDDDELGGPIRVLGDRVYVTRATDGQEGLWAFEPPKPPVRWWKPAGIGSYGDPVVVAGDELVFEDGAGGVIAVKAGGAQRQLLDHLGAAGVDNLAAGAGLIYAIHDEDLVKIDAASGESTVVLHGGVDVIGTDEGFVYLQFGDRAARLPHVVSPTP